MNNKIHFSIHVRVAHSESINGIWTPTNYSCLNILISFIYRLKELETTVAVLREEVDTLNVKMKGKQEEIDNLSE